MKTTKIWKCVQAFSLEDLRLRGKSAVQIWVIGGNDQYNKF